jgi:STE24 endopeptidase
MFRQTTFRPTREPSAVVSQDFEESDPGTTRTANSAARKAGLALRRAFCRRFVWLCLFLLPALQSPAQTPEKATSTVGTFSAEAAAKGYLDRQTPEQKARSDAYFEGGYWLQLWQFLYGAGVSVVLLQTRLSARMRDLAYRLSRFKPIQTAAYAILYVLITSLLAFPLTTYSDFFREHAYNMATQTFAGWFGDWLKELLVAMIVGSVAMVALFGVVRKLQNSWHIWGALLMLLFLVILILIGPVFIAPLFNKYTALEKPDVVEPILRLTRANGITADKVYEMDASRQTTRVSANVSGALGTMRITLNDNLLNRCSLSEIQAVMGHEMGHYVLNHIYKGLLFFGVVIVIGFALLHWSLGRALDRFGKRWGISSIGDVAIMPLVVLLFSAYLFVLTPINNTFIRTQEMEADLFGLNAARQPDGFAEVALKLGEYRKMQPGPVEEWIFFDHPSGATRIRNAMRWKAENLGQASEIR